MIHERSFQQDIRNKKDIIQAYHLETDSQTKKMN